MEIPKTLLLILTLASCNIATASPKVSEVTRQRAQSSAITAVYLYKHGAGMTGLQSASEQCWAAKYQAKNLDCALFDMAAHEIDYVVIRGLGNNIPEREYFTQDIFMERAGTTIFENVSFANSNNRQDMMSAANEYLRMISAVIRQYTNAEVVKEHAWH